MKTPEPPSRSTPEYLFWYGCQRYILYLRVLVFEQTDEGEWRAIRKNGKWHDRMEDVILHILGSARREKNVKDEDNDNERKIN